MSDGGGGCKAAFLANVLTHNASVISLIDTKAGLILGSAAVLLTILAFLDADGLGAAARAALVAALASFGAAAVLSFLTILPRITAWTRGETAIFYISVVKQSREEYRAKVRAMTDEQIIDDYANNIYALAAVQAKKFRMLAGALCSMMISVCMMAAAIFIHIQAQ